MATKVRKGQWPGNLHRAEFSARFRNSFVDPAFRSEDVAIGRLEVIAWDAYCEGRKAPLTRKAGPGYADPDYDLSVEWIEASERLKRAQAVWVDPKTKTRALVICGSPRNDGTCPGEISKTFRLARLVNGVLREEKIEVDFLDLSLLTSGVETSRRALSDWLDWMGLVDAGDQARLDRYIGYFEPYATSHDTLDKDEAVQEETRNVARAVARVTRALRKGELKAELADLPRPRPK